MSHYLLHPPKIRVTVVSEGGETLDYSQIVLTRHQMRCLIAVSKDATQTPEREIAEQLRRKGLIKRNHVAGGNPLDYSGAYSLTDSGLEYIQYRKQYARHRRVDMIRYIITTAITVAAFIKSFFF